MKNTYSVGQVNRYIKNMFTQDYLLQKIYVKGEVSNCKYHTSGHIYFSLKDETGTLNCVMFAGHRRGLAFAMKNGDKVIVGGSVDVYERDGRYQMYAKEITLEGAGTLYERYLALKQELEQTAHSEIYQTSGCGNCTDRCGCSGYPQYFLSKKSLFTDYFISGSCTGGGCGRKYCKRNTDA